MRNTPIPAAGEAMPTISTLLCGTVGTSASHTLKIDELCSLSAEELTAFIDLLTTLDDVVCAFTNQSRFCNRYGRLNAAGGLADELNSHLSNCISLVEQAAMDTKPTTAQDAKDRAWLLIKRAAHYSEDLSTFVSVAAQLSVSALEVEAA